MDEAKTPETAARVMPNVIGPGAVSETVGQFNPSLDAATRDEVIEIMNPLTVDFVAKVGVTKTAMMPVRIVNPNNTSIRTEADLASKGIAGFRNPDKGGGVVHIQNQVPIPAGSVIRQPGDVAQIIVKQLVSAVISMRGEQHKLADPATREKVEREVIISRRPMSELFGGGGPITVEEQMKIAIEKANEQVTEPEFPQLTVEPSEPTPAQLRAAHARAVKAQKNG